MANLKERWKAPTPEFWKAVIKISLTAAAGAGAILLAEPAGKAIIPGFTFTLFPWAEILCKNLVVAGIAVAAMAKFTVKDTDSK